MTVKTKIRVALLFPLVVVVMLGGISSYYISRLAKESKDIIRDNYKTLEYSKGMIEALDGKDFDDNVKKFEHNLALQENNITEKGEYESTHELRLAFERFKKNPSDTDIIHNLHSHILNVQDINAKAINDKNEELTQKTNSAYLLISVVGIISLLLSGVFIIRFQLLITRPVGELSKGIKSILNKDYSIRLHIDSDDEFGQLSDAFNKMAHDLHFWENSNLSQLMSEKSRIETIINNMNEMIVVMDEKGVILFANDMAESMLGINKNELLGKNVQSITVQGSVAQSLLGKENNSVKIVVNNKENYFLKSFRPVTSLGQTVGELLVLHNITPFKELDLAKTNFIAMITHELKTPLSNIKLVMDLFRIQSKEAITQPEKKLIESIGDETNRLNRIISELLNLTQIETGNIQLNINEVAPVEIVALAVEAIQPMLDQKHLKLKVTIDEEVEYVSADLDKTAWVIINFLTNAIRYSTDEDEIVLLVKFIDRSARFEVTDTGPGIDQQYISQVFDRYFKIPGQKGGTGMGLAICKEFIEAQKGIIGVISEVNKGSTFYFTLPLK